MSQPEFFCMQVFLALGLAAAVGFSAFMLPHGIYSLLVEHRPLFDSWIPMLFTLTVLFPAAVMIPFARRKPRWSMTPALIGGAFLAMTIYMDAVGEAFSLAAIGPGVLVMLTAILFGVLTGKVLDLRSKSGKESGGGANRTQGHSFTGPINASTQ